MFGRKKPNRIAAILIAAILVTQFNVTSFGAEAGNYAGSGESVSGPVVHFTVPPRSAEPEPEAPVYPTATPIPNFTPVFPTFPTNLPIQTPVVIPTPIPTVNPTPAVNPGKNPTTVPTQNPSAGKTQNPTVQPTAAPTQNPSVNPTAAPTANPTTIPADKQGVKTTPTPVSGVTLSSNNRSQEYLNKEEELKNMGMPENVRNYVLSKYIDKKNPESVRENLLNLMEEAAEIKSIEFKEKEILIIQGEKTRLEPVIRPDNAKEELIWESDNENIVTVDEEGFAEGINPGETTITVRAENGVYAKCSVKCLRSDSIAARMKSIFENGSESVSENVSENNLPLDTVSDDSVESGSVSDDEITPDGADEITELKFQDGGEAVSVTIDQSVRPKLIIKPDGASEKGLLWDIDSGITARATVDKEGNVTGKQKSRDKDDLLTLTVRVPPPSTVKATCKIKVISATPTDMEGVKINGISVTDITLIEGEKVDITPDILPRTGVDEDDKIAEWSITDRSVASILRDVGKTNTITGEDGGTNGRTTKLNVSLKDFPRVKTSCNVTVKPRIPINKITLTPEKDKIFIGEPTNFRLDTEPSNANDTELVWKISNTPSSITVASVDTDNKTVRGQGEGKVTITASLKSNPSVTGSCTIEVIPVPVDSISLTTSPDPLEIAKGQTGTISVTVNPISPYPATNKTVTWTSSDESIVKIESPLSKTTTSSRASITVKGVEPSDREITITATLQDGTKTHTATCKVKVKPPEKVTGLTVDKPSIKELEVGSNETITATVLPEDATNKTVTWSIVGDSGIISKVSNTQNKNIARCTVKGLVSGNVILRASVDDDGDIHEADCEITVIPKKVKKVELLPNPVTMYEADPTTMIQTLSATISPQDASYNSVTWSIDDESVATLSGNELLSRTVTGLKPGGSTKVTVTVTTDDKVFTDESTITIKKKIVSINGIDLIVDPDPMVIKRGGSGQLSWKFTPDDADEDIKASTPVVLSSANPEIAAVNPETAIGEGSATVSGCSVGETDITVATADGKYSGTCHVKVEWTDVTGVSLSCNEIDLYEGETQKLIATVEPGNADIKTVSWNSASPGTASVDQEGIVTGVKEGTTVVTVVTVDGGKKDFCIVHVHKRGKEAEGIIVNPSENRIDLSVNPEFDLTAILFPEGATDKKITWKSNNTAVVTVSGDNINGLTAKAVGKAKGTAVITATTSNGKTAVCLVTVDEPSKVYVEDVYLDQMRKTIYVGESFDLTANVMPDNAYDKTVTWSSGDGKIATVSEGRVTGLKKGEVTITVTANGDTLDGEPAIAICYVTVKDEPQPAPDVYKLFIVDERSGAYRPDKVRGTVESLAGDRYLVIRDSSGSEIKPLINGDSSLSYTRALYYDMWIVDINGWPKEDFVKCTVRIPLPKDMDINKGTVRVVTMLNGRLDKSISSSVGEEDGVQYVSFTTTHFTQYAILYKEVSKQTSTTVVYRDVPVIQYRETTSQPVYYTQPAPAQTIPFVNTRVLDNVPRTGEGINLRERLCEIFTSKPKQEK